MTDKSLRTVRRIGIMAATAAIGILGFGPLAGSAVAATPSHAATVTSASGHVKPAAPLCNGWQC